MKITDIYYCMILEHQSILHSLFSKVVGVSHFLLHDLEKKKKLMHESAQRVNNRAYNKTQNTLVKSSQEGKILFKCYLYDGKNVLKTWTKSSSTIRAENLRGREDGKDSHSLRYLVP